MELFHVMSRGVEKRITFEEQGDYLRFVHDLFAFNNKNIVANPLSKERHTTERRKLVDIFAWCCMPNHYHLLLSPIDDDMSNLSMFAKKLNMGYAKYFNEKYKRSGALWQGKYRKVHIARDAHFMHIPYYIHLNPLDLSMPEWRTGGVRDISRAMQALESYRWSSYLDYNARKNFPSIIVPDLLCDILGAPQKQHRTIIEIITNDELASPSAALELV